MDVAVEPNAIESPPNQRPTRRRSNDPTKRRALKVQESDRINEIRSIMDMEPRVSKLEVLNAGAGIWSIAVVGLAIHHPRFF